VIDEVQTAKPLLTAAELSAATELTPAQVYRWAAEGRFPTEYVFRVGRRVYYRRALLDWLAGRNGQHPSA
jgi:predicted DNA-binding transcriptional regulator AlpA